MLVDPTRPPRYRPRALRFAPGALLGVAFAIGACELAYPTAELSSETGLPAPSAGGSGPGGGHPSGGHPATTGGATGGASGCECVPAETEQASCGRCGQRLRVCNDDCTWALFGDCADEGPCAPSDVSTMACGKCGHKTRSCGTDCAWGDYGVCTAEGACAPGDTSELPCGKCGHKTRTCLPTCAWSDYGLCTSEGPCAPGQTQSCGPCVEETCGATCQWGACEKAGFAECTDQSGTIPHCCGGNHWQFCNKATCKWYPCATCSGCGC